LFAVIWYGRQGQFAPDVPDQFGWSPGLANAAAGRSSLVVPSDYLEVVITRR
jgi:hypothetical protein